MQLAAKEVSVLLTKRMSVQLRLAMRGLKMRGDFTIGNLEGSMVRHQRVV